MNKDTQSDNAEQMNSQSDNAEQADAEKQKKRENKKEDSRKNVPKRRYFLVKFGGKTSEMQTRDIFLSLNGFGRLIKRNQYVVLPESYLEIARHAMVKTFSVDPATGDRTPTEIQNYPFDTICEASETIYREMLQNGKTLTDGDVERIKEKAYAFSGKS